MPEKLNEIPDICYICAFGGEVCRNTAVTSKHVSKKEIREVMISKEEAGVCVEAMQFFPEEQQWENRIEKGW